MLLRLRTVEEELHHGRGRGEGERVPYRHLPCLVGDCRVLCRHCSVPARGDAYPSCEPARLCERSLPGHVPFGEGRGRDAWSLLWFRAEYVARLCVCSSCVVLKLCHLSHIVLFKQVPYTMTKFVVYEMVAEQIFASMGTPKEKLPNSTLTTVNLGSGLIAGICAAIISQPADTLLSKINKQKVRLDGRGGAVFCLWNDANSIAYLTNHPLLLKGRRGQHHVASCGPRWPARRPRSLPRPRCAYRYGRYVDRRSVCHLRRHQAHARCDRWLRDQEEGGCDRSQEVSAFMRVCNVHHCTHWAKD